MDKIANQMHRGSNISELSDDSGFQCNIDPLTRKGRSTLLLGLVFLPLVSGLALGVYSSVQLSQSLGIYKAADDFIHHAETAVETMELLEVLQEYAAVSYVYRMTNYSGLFGPLATFLTEVEDHASRIPSWSGSSSNYLAGLETLMESFCQFKGKNVSESLSMDYQYCINVQWAIMTWMSQTFMENSFEAWGLKSSFLEVAHSYASLGIEKGMSLVYYFWNEHTEEDYFTFVEHKTVSHQHLAYAVLQNELVTTRYSALLKKYPSVVPGINEFRKHVVPNMTIENMFYEGMVVYYKYGTFQIMLKELLITLYKRMKLLAEKQQEESVDNMIYSGMKILAIGLIMLPFIVISARGNMRSLLVYSITMEKNNLQLREDKRKIDTILNQMLPRSVAYKLRRGEAIAAEEYAEATIFFSDIVDFDEISSSSSPLQIVNFLNDIYNFMDNQLQKYDVYKVETIGCVYMVVSGVPMRNGHRHVTEISRMALDILSTTQNFVIAHLPERNLLIRIGLHSGAVVAGVIGNITPRYCLFGDSVNTASRMQSHGLARTIHVSQACKEALDIVGGFVCEERGTVEIKGKGLMTTYWLKARTEQDASPVSNLGEDNESYVC